MEENNNNAGSDSDSNSVEESQEDYYEPISAVDLDGGDNDDDEGEDNYLAINGFSNGLPNGHCTIPEAVDGIASISINEHAEAKSDTEEETVTVTPDSEIRTAFEEDERRRRSPLLVENAARVMEAMRAISFPGTAPDWASEDRWVDQLRRLRSTSQKSMKLVVEELEKVEIAIRENAKQLYAERLKLVGRDINVENLVDLRKAQLSFKLSDELAEDLFREHTRTVAIENISSALSVLKSRTRAV